MPAAAGPWQGAVRSQELQLGPDRADRHSTRDTLTVGSQDSNPGTRPWALGVLCGTLAAGLTACLLNAHILLSLLNRTV